MTEKSEEVGGERHRRKHVADQAAKMYLFYIDESGHRNPVCGVDEPFVVLSLCIHEFQWRRLERNINARKLKLIGDVHDRTGLEFKLSDVEVKANTVRIPSERAKHQFFRFLSKDELTSLTNLMYDQLELCHIWIHAVVVDKRCLRGYLDTEKLSRKTYELMLERGEKFISEEHPNQNRIFVLDTTSQQLDRSMALKHSHFQGKGTTSGLRLRHIIELPMFVDSRLSNGVQLADLCAYNVFRAFRNKRCNIPVFSEDPSVHLQESEAGSITARRAEDLSGGSSVV